MLPDPLHPAVIHLPIALAVLIPGFAALSIYLIHKEFLPSRSWGAIVLLQALLVGSAWIALETGEREEDRVERVVAESHIETHEEAAERFFVFAWIGLVAIAAGLLPARMGTVSRAVGTVASLGVLAAAVYVGHFGSELVYRYGAATAYVDGPGAAGSARSDEHFDDD